MRPKRLSIEGLNSFIERQTIDFDRLTEKGFFGIFGPTGSGKSTILDGITLALYGRIARGSAEFVNKQVDTLSLCYEFSLGQQLYKVEREIKRNKNGEIRTAYAKLTELTLEGEQVLEDKASSVSKRCEEIIGLSVDDFSRTVVLPQGKFSEFLKLPNGQRREMLERIFNLEAFGVDLSAKVARHLSLVKSELATINGQLMGYEDVNEANWQQLKCQVVDAASELNAQLALLQAKEAAYSEAKLIFERQSHLIQTQNLLNEHLLLEESFKTNGLMLEQHDKALRVKAHWESYEQTVAAQQSTVAEMTKLKGEYDVIAAERQQSEKVLGDLTRKLENEVPELRTKLDLLKQGRKDIEVLMKDKAQLDGDKLQLIELEKQAKEVLEQFQSLQKRYEALEILERQLEADLEAVKTPESYKNQVRKSLLAAEALHRQVINLDSLQREEKLLADNQALYLNQIEAIALQVQSLEDLQRQSDAALIQYRDEEGAASKLLNQLQLIKDKLSFLLQQKINLEDERLQLQQVKKAQTPLAQQLSLENVMTDQGTSSYWLNHFQGVYHECGTCPVCGQQSQLQAVKKIEEAIERLELQWQGMCRDNEVKALEGQPLSPAVLAAVEKEIQQVEQNLTAIRLAIQTAEHSAKVHGESLSAALQQQSRVRAESTMMEQQLEVLRQKREAGENERRDLESAWNKLNDELKEDHRDLPHTALGELVRGYEADELKAEGIQAELKVIKGQLITAKAQREEKLTLRMEAESALQLKKNALEIGLRHYQDQKDRLTAKLGNLMSVKAECERIELELEHFEASYQQEKINQQSLSEVFAKRQQQYSELTGRARDLEQTAIDQLAFLQQQLLNQGFANVSLAKAAILDDKAVATLKEDVRAYQKRLDELTGTLSALKQKMEDVTFDEAQYEALSQEYSALKLTVSEKEQELAQLRLKQQQIEERLQTMAVLIEQRDRSQYRQAQLQELAKLFEARKFVAFIASTQMAYISGKASEQLLQMTQGSYGIEAQADGSFLIRDYKNGGVTRDVSTLSGGETFLVSLALALALSAQVQLKGRAPLELFFLDEGFGTLDDETLEVVISALEGLSHEKLSIGLISHVEAIKNRVPIKLMVTPAKSGLGGSRIKIELS